MHGEYKLKWSLDRTPDSWPLREGMIGRLPTCCFRVNSTHVRDEHARISLRDGKWWVAAMSGSINQHDGAEVHELELKPGVEFYLGQVKFVVGDQNETDKEATHDKRDNHTLSPVPSFDYTEGLRKFFPGKPYYRIGLIGASQAGKTTFVCALAGSNADPDGYRCVWQKALNDQQSMDLEDAEIKSAVAQFHKGLQNTKESLSKINSGDRPVVTSVTDGILRYAFLVSAKPDSPEFIVELVDYAGEGVETNDTMDERVRNLRRNLRETDGLLVLAQFQPDSNGQSHSISEFDKLNTVFQAIGGKGHVTDWVRPVCLAVSKWDRKSIIEEKPKEVAELKNLIDENAGSILSSFATDLQRSFGKNNLKILPLSSFGAREIKGGDDVPAGGRMKPFMVIDPLIWLRERIDELRVETFARNIANLEIPDLSHELADDCKINVKIGPLGIFPVIKNLGLDPCFSKKGKAERQVRRERAELALAALKDCDPDNEIVKSLRPRIVKVVSTARKLHSLCASIILLLALTAAILAIGRITSDDQPEEALRAWIEQAEATEYNESSALYLALKDFTPQSRQTHSAGLVAMKKYINDAISDKELYDKIQKSPSDETLKAKYRQRELLHMQNIKTDEKREVEFELRFVHVAGAEKCRHPGTVVAQLFKTDFLGNNKLRIAHQGWENKKSLTSRLHIKPEKPGATLGDAMFKQSDYITLEIVKGSYDVDWANIGLGGRRIGPVSVSNILQNKHNYLEILKEGTNIRIRMELRALNNPWLEGLPDWEPRPALLEKFEL